MANLAISLPADTHIRMPLVPPSLEGPITVCGWLRIDEISPDGFSTLFQWGADADFYVYPQLHLYIGDGTPTTLSTDDGGSFQEKGFAPAVGEWFYFAYLFERTGPESLATFFYVNGVEDEYAIGTPDVLNAGLDRVVVGDPRWEWRFIGSVAGLKVFNRSLTIPEQLAESAQRAPVGANCIGAWGLRGLTDLANLVAGAPAELVYRVPLEPVEPTSVAGPAALDGDESEVLLPVADIPTTIEVENLLAEPLVMVQGLRFEPGETKTVRLSGLSPGAKCDLWEALRIAEANSLLAAGGMAPLADPVPSGHTASGGHQLTGGQNPLGTVTPTP